MIEEKKIPDDFKVMFQRLLELKCFLKENRHHNDQICESAYRMLDEALKFKEEDA